MAKTKQDWDGLASLAGFLIDPIRNGISLTDEEMKSRRDMLEPHVKSVDIDFIHNQRDKYINGHRQARMQCLLHAWSFYTHTARYAK
jgi:hypothetical protein